MPPTEAQTTAVSDIQVHLPTGTQTLCFHFAWPAYIGSLTPPSTHYKSALGDFTFLVNNHDGYFKFTLTRVESTESFFATSYLIKSLDRRTLASGTIAFGHTKISAAIAEKIPKTLLAPRGGSYEIEVCFSNKVVTDSLRPLRPTIADLIMDRLYRDTAHHDVFFEFDDDESIMDRIAQEIPGVFSRKPLAVTAHKHVLRQWPYFQRMFESEFIEGGEGEKKIQIKDVNSRVFQTLVRFMYAGYIPQDEQPTKVTDSKTNSWESLFLAAHRYELEELCQMAQRHIVARITPDEAIPLLFRSGYKYDDLRESLVKLIALRSSSVVSGKPFRDQYSDHPEFGLLVHEIYQESRILHSHMNLFAAANRLWPIDDESATKRTLERLPKIFNRKPIIIGAHKNVLRQWPYFRRMFDSEFEKGESDEKKIQIKDARPKAFQALIRYMYAGYPPQDERYPPESAHRYELLELCHMAQKHIVAKIMPDRAISLLFRSGYKYGELSAALVKIVALTSASVVAGHLVCEQYCDHPGFGLLVHEIYQVGHQRK
ncbi:hypothetical protein BG000_008768 [Podila horticola]|nr:hypothetical protein BG000_008768 [Podila horticola]